MCIRAGVLAAVALSLAIPASAQQPKSRRAMVWELAVSLSGGVVYRMDSMPLQNKAGNEMLEHARVLAPRLGVTLPDHAALKGTEVDTMVAVPYLYDAAPHPVAVSLAEKDFAGRLEAAALEAQLPRATWGGLVDALRAGAAKNDRIEAMIAMLKTVAAAVK